MPRRLLTMFLWLSPTFLGVVGVVAIFTLGAFRPMSLAEVPAVVADSGMPSLPDMIAAAEARAKTVDNPGIFVDGIRQPNLESAGKNSRPGSVIELRGVVLNEAIILRDPGVTLKAVGSAIYGAAAQGKAAIVAKGDTIVIDGLECFGVTVRDRNGACIRDESNNLTVRNVHFHDSENGILVDGRAGPLLIEDSVIERNGAIGRAHNIYYSGKVSLTLRRSRILSATGEGHEVKSRAALTTIEDSVIAGLAGLESRAIDIPNGGTLIVRNTMIEKGPAARNRNVIGYGLEPKKPQRETRRIVLENVLVISDMKDAAPLIDMPKEGAFAPEIKNVTAVGNFKQPLPAGVRAVANRKAAKLPPYPALPNPPAPR